MADQLPDARAQTTLHRRVDLRWLLVFAAMVTGIVYQLLFHLSPDAPMRSPGIRSPQLEQIQQLLTNTDRAIDSASDGQNVELHFAPGSSAFAKGFSTIYFHTAYALYPHRLLLGHDEKVINNADQMFSADVLPPPDWMKQHNVAAVLTLYPPDSPTGSPVMRVHPLR